jgi:hypothetical protein
MYSATHANITDLTQVDLLQLGGKIFKDKSVCRQTASGTPLGNRSTSL